MARVGTHPFGSALRLESKSVILERFVTDSQAALTIATGPAQRAGIMPADVILVVDGEPV